MKKLLKILASMALTLVITISSSPQSVINASSTTPPTSLTYDYNLDGSLLEDPFGCGAYGTNYSAFSFYPNVDYNKLTIRIDAACSDASNVSFRLTCYDATTGKEVGSKSLRAAEYQYATFTGLNSSHFYYFKYTGYSKYYIAGYLYVSEDGTYPFSSQL